MDLPIENLAISEEGPPVEKTTFLSLPDDILTRIIEKELSAADRKNLAMVNDRLRAIEEKAGYRNIYYVTFWTAWNHLMEGASLEIIALLHTYSGHDRDRGHFDANTPEKDVLEFFNNASIKNLEIRGKLGTEQVRRLRAVVNTATLKQLTFEITDENSCRMNCVTEVEIDLEHSKLDAANTNQLILALPPMNKYTIRNLRRSVRISESVLLYLVRNVPTVDLLCYANAITVIGAFDALEIICSGDRPRKVRFYLGFEYFAQFSRRNKSRNESGATVEISAEDDMFLIEMQSVPLRES